VDKQFDEAMVNALVDVFFEGVLAEQVRTSPDSRTIGSMPPAVTPLVACEGIRAVLAALSQDYAIVARVRIEEAKHAINTYPAFNCEGTPTDCGRLTYMAGEYLKLIAELEASPDGV
jgi:hypothetical protein